MNNDKVKNKLLSGMTEFKLVILLEWLIKRTSKDYKDSFLDQLRVSLIFSNRNSMRTCTRQVKREKLSLFTSSCIGKEHTLKTKLREFVILSKDKDMNFQPCKRFRIKWIKLKMVLVVPKMFGWKQRNNSEINLKYSTKLIMKVWIETMIRLSNQPCTCIKCS